MSTQHTTILLHVRRTRVEDAYVSVPVTDAVLRAEADAEGNRRIDVEAFVREGVAIAGNPTVEWRVEEERTEMHPVQKPLPEDRTSFCPSCPDDEEAQKEAQEEAQNNGTDRGRSGRTPS
jgi:hypothetical protein